MESLQKTKGDVQRLGKKWRETLHRYGIGIPGWVQLLIWAITVAVFVWLTISGSLPLILNYINDDKNVAIQTMIILNERFPPPQFVLKIPHYLTEKDKALGRISDHLLNGTEADCFECQRLANASWDVWREINISKNDYYDVYHSLTAAFMRKLLSNASIESDFDALNGSNSEWNAPVVDAALNFLIWRHGLDRYFKPQFDSSGNEIASVDSDYADHAVNGTRLFDLLQSRILRALCQRITIQLSYPFQYKQIVPPEQSCEDILINNTMPVVIDADALWIHLHSDNSLECKFVSYFQSPNNISMWTSSRVTKEEGWIWLYSDSLQLYFSEIDNGHNKGWSTLAAGNTASGRRPFISVDYSVSMRMKEERERKMKECYYESSPKVCIQKCTKRWTIEHCNCLPFTFRKGLPWGYVNGSVPIGSLPYCNERTYNSCDPMQFNDNDREQCFNECRDPCEYTSYNYVVMTDVYPEKMEVDTGFTIVLRPITADPIVQFSNSTQNNVDEFIAKVGGVIGLYLGLTFVSLLTFLINCVDFTQQCIRRRKDRKKRKSLGISMFRVAALMRMLQLARKNEDVDGEELSTDQSDSEKEDENIREEITSIKDEMERVKKSIARLQALKAKNNSLGHRLVHKLQYEK